MSGADPAREIEFLVGAGRRREAAQVLLAGWRLHEVTTSDLRRLIPEIWLYLDPPTGDYGALGDDDWLELFAGSGFFMHGPVVTLDLESYVLFRAAPPERARGMSWCTDRRIAEAFLPKHDQYGTYSVWSAIIPRTSILAVLYRPTDTFIASGTDFAREIVVSPAGLSELVVAR